MPNPSVSPDATPSRRQRERLYLLNLVRGGDPVLSLLKKPGTPIEAPCRTVVRNAQVPETEAYGSPSLLSFSFAGWPQGSKSQHSQL